MIQVMINKKRKARQEHKCSYCNGTINKGEKYHFSRLKYDDKTLVVDEAPHKLKATLAEMAEIFGNDRKISLCRELTKINEETKNGSREHCKFFGEVLCQAFRCDLSKGEYDQGTNEC